MREAAVGASSLAAVVLRGDRSWAAVSPGASVTLVRAGFVVETVTTSATLDLGEGDRLVLLCAGLHALVGGGDELGRLVSGDDTDACALTLREIGHMRGGTGLWAVVADIGEATQDGSAPSAAPPDFQALLSQLAPAIADVTRKLTPAPMASRPPPERSAVSQEESTHPFAGERAARPASTVPPPELEMRQASAVSHDRFDGSLSDVAAPPRPVVGGPPIWAWLAAGSMALVVLAAVLLALW